MAAIGDIVLHKSEKYVVAEFLPHPSGGRMTRIVSYATGHPPSTQFTSFVKDEAGLHVVESPHFVIGERVMVDKRWGGVTSITDNIIFVWMDVAELPLTNAPRIKIEIEEASAAVPKWKVVLENRLP